MSDTEVKESQQAPDFTLAAIGPEDVVKNDQIHLSDLRGKNIVLYFYPKSMTAGCTAEACSFRDNYEVFKQAGANVIATVQRVNTLLPHALASPGRPSLRFLGVGIQPPLPSWGNMLVDGRRYVDSAWWIATFPGTAIFLTVLSINLVGDGLRDALDPYRR